MRVRKQNLVIPSIEQKGSSPGLFEIQIDPNLLILIAQLPKFNFGDSIGTVT
jgi:hypothetical protein